MKKKSFKHFTNYENEIGETGYYESVIERKTIVEDKPIQVGQAILQTSKLHFLRFVKFLNDFLIKDSFKFCYADTDSIYIGKYIYNDNIIGKFNIYIYIYI